MVSMRAQSEKSSIQKDGLRTAITELAAQKSSIYGKTLKVDGQLEEAFALVIAEIGQTVLPRLITLDCQPAGRMYLTVSHRRLFECRISDTIVSGATQASDDIQALALTFVVELKRFFSLSQTIKILKPAPIEEIGDSSMSCSAQLLWDVASTNTPEPVYETRSKECVAGLKDVAQAWILYELEETRTEAYGSEADQAMLEAIRSLVLPTSGEPRPKLFTKGKDTYFVCPLDAASAVCTVQSPSLQFIALVSTRDVDILDALSDQKGV